MSAPNEPKPLGSEEIEALLAAATGSDLANEVVVGAFVRAIRVLAAENATLQKQRDMMTHLLNGGTFTPEEIVAAGLGMCTLEDQAHAIYHLRQENATLRADVDDLIGVGARYTSLIQDLTAERDEMKKEYAETVSRIEDERNAVMTERDQLKARVAELEKRTLRTVDHPEARGRAPKYGDQAWTLSFPLEDGSVLKLEMGKESYDKFSQFLLDEMANAPDYEEGEGIANEVVCLRTQLATANAQNAELLGMVGMAVPILHGSNSDTINRLVERMKAALAQAGGKVNT